MANSAVMPDELAYTAALKFMLSCTTKMLVSTVHFFHLEAAVRVLFGLRGGAVADGEDGRLRCRCRCRVLGIVASRCGTAADWSDGFLVAHCCENAARLDKATVEIWRAILWSLGVVILAARVEVAKVGVRRVCLEVGKKDQKKIVLNSADLPPNSISPDPSRRSLHGTSLS
ncbi:hypothetical protein KC361_g26 [Hortaea werneckii]|nr:hypothetical protein KC361_g26 [Hortaea werneckii]